MKSILSHNNGEQNAQEHSREAVQELYKEYQIPSNEKKSSSLNVDEHLFLNVRKIDIQQQLLSDVEQRYEEELDSVEKGYIAQEILVYKKLLKDMLGDISITQLQQNVQYCLTNLFQKPQAFATRPSLYEVTHDPYSDYYAFATYEQYLKKVEQERSKRQGDIITRYEADPKKKIMALQHDPVLQTLKNEVDWTKGYVDALYDSPLVKITRAYVDHVDAIANIQEKKSQIIEFEEIRPLLKKMDTLLYADQHAKKVAGVMLAGPPGMGKSTILNYYFQTYRNIKPISVDITRFDNKFTLVASESLKSNNRLEKVDTMIENLENLPKEAIPALLKKVGATSLEDVQKFCDESKLEILAREIKELQMTEGFKFYAVTQALLENRPIIFDEFINLSDWSFLNGLFEAEPCTDKERAPHPKEAPEGDDVAHFPRGWWYNNITHQWMKVPENFRICFTGNIGVEYGNQGMQRALSSRYEGRQLAIPSITPSMQVKLLWALISNPLGEVVVSSECAHRLYTLVTAVFPLIDKRFQELKTNLKPLSMRTIIALGKSVYNSSTNEKADSQEEIDMILWDLLLEPCLANGQIEQGRWIAQELFGAQFLQTKAVAQKTLQVFKQKTQSGIVTLDLVKIRGERCPVCGVKKCLLHADLFEAKQNLRYEDVLTIKLLRSTVVKDSLLQTLSEKTDVFQLVDKLYSVSRYVQQEPKFLVDMSLIENAVTTMINQAKEKDEYDVLIRTPKYQQLILMLYSFSIKAVGLEDIHKTLIQAEIKKIANWYIQTKNASLLLLEDLAALFPKDDEMKSEKIAQVSPSLVVKYWKERESLLKKVSAEKDLREVLLFCKKIEELFQEAKTDSVADILKTYGDSTPKKIKSTIEKSQENSEKSLMKELLPSSIKDVSLPLLIVLMEMAKLRKDVEEITLIYFLELRFCLQELKDDRALLEKASILIPFYSMRYGS